MESNEAIAHHNETMQNRTNTIQPRHLYYLYVVSYGAGKMECKEMKAEDVYQHIKADAEDVMHLNQLEAYQPGCHFITNNGALIVSLA